MANKVSRKTIVTLKETLEASDSFVSNSVKFSTLNSEFLNRLAKTNNALSDAIEIIEKQNKLLKKVSALQRAKTNTLKT